jgi:phosphohistidine phosphatase
MHLYFLRHGKAEERRPDLTEYDRHLTPEGIEEMQAEARAMAALSLRFDALFSSPLPRALETARIVQTALGLPDSLLAIEPRIAEAFLFGDLQSLLFACPANSRILLVGHEPYFSMLVGELIGGAEIALKKGGLAYVEANRLEPGQGVLHWLLTPKLLIRSGSDR